MLDKSWKIGEDLSTYDSLLDGVTFDDLILAVHHNSRIISSEAVLDEWVSILSQRLEDAVYLLNMNMEEIMAEARKGREL